MSSSRGAAGITAAFKKGKSESFVAYVTAGYPTRADTVPALLALQEGGASIIELGVPFSDPMADGGTIQKANQTALENGVTVDDCLEFVRQARAQGLIVPLVFMGYYNPFMQFGEARLAAESAAAAVDGFIVVDLPPEDAGPFVAACDAHGLGFTPLVAPTTAAARFPAVAAVARGFVYCVSVLGVTGARAALPADLTDLIRTVKSHISLPVAVGFGISTRAQVVALGAVADGVVVGSAIVSRLGSGGVAGIRSLLQELLPEAAAAGGPVA